MKSIKYNLICDCGENMIVDSGACMIGLIVETDLIRIGGERPTSFRGFTENFICPKCKKTDLIYIGVRIKNGEK